MPAITLFFPFDMKSMGVINFLIIVKIRSVKMKNIICIVLAIILFVIPNYTFCLQQDIRSRLEITLQDAILMAFENNKSLKIQKLNPKIQGLKEVQQQAVFDTSISSSISSSLSEGSTGKKSRRSEESAEISKSLTSGANISLKISSTNSNGSTTNDFYTSRFSISFRQPLLNGFGKDVNLIGIKQADFNTQSSYLELQAYAESLLKQVIDTYWDYALAMQELKIYEESLKLAREQLRETEAMIDVGKLAEIELISSQAEVALREQSLINMHNQCEKLRIKLLKLMVPNDVDLWAVEIGIKDKFVIPEIEVGKLEEHIKRALELRPDLNKAKLSLKSGELEIVKTKNGLLPKLDFFITLGETGYAKTFGTSFGDIFNEGYDIQLGLIYQYKFGKRSEKASYEQLLLRNEQEIIALENMELTIQEDLRNAFLEMERTKKQIEASKLTIRLQEEKLRAEVEKYRIGKSTSINVAQAQRDLLNSKVTNAQAIAGYLKAVVNLFLSEGTLLEQYGIEIAGM